MDTNSGLSVPADMKMAVDTVVRPVDPVLWTTDAVVQYLCYDSFEPWALGPQSRPDPTVLEPVLREHRITGWDLLTKVTEHNLEHRFGIKAFGECGTILRAIDYLRAISEKYKNWVQIQFCGSIPSGLTAETPGSGCIRSKVHWLLKPPAPRFHSVPPSTPEFSRRRGLLLPPSTDTANGVQDNFRSPSRPPSVSRSVSNDLTLRQNEHAVVDNDGRKRRRITLAPTSIVRVQTENNKEWYIGPHKLTAPEMFYEGTENDKDEFSFVQQATMPTAKRLFANQRMQHFLQQPVKMMTTRAGNKALALLPYEADLVKEHKLPHYFTLYSKDDNGDTIATKENIEDWPGIAGGNSMFNALLARYPARLDDNPDDPETWSNLGDSDVELDPDTLKEMEEERQEAPTRPKQLSPAGLDQIIDNCILEFSKIWHTEKQPYEARKARRMWILSRKDGTKRDLIRAATAEIGRLDHRLRRLRVSVKDSEWTKETAVRHQCQSVENTVFDREHLKWKISVLESRKCPAPPTALVKKRRLPRPKVGSDDEESLNSDDSPSDNFEHFVVPDEVTNELERRETPEAMQLDDGESDDSDKSSESSESSSGDSIITPGRKKRTTGSPHETHDSEHEDTRATRCRLTGPAKSRKKPKILTDTIEMIDLTRRSDLEKGNQASQPESDNAFNIETPPLNPIPSFPGTVSDLDSEIGLSQDQKQTATKSQGPLPELTDAEGIQQMEWDLLAERTDRKRLLAKLVFGITKEEQEELRNLMGSIDLITCRSYIKKALRALYKGRPEIKSLSVSESQLHLRLATFFISWHHCEKIDGKGIKKEQIEKAVRLCKEKRKGKEMRQFYPALLDILGIHQEKPTSGKQVSHTTPSKQPTVTNGLLSPSKRSQPPPPTVLLDDSDAEPIGVEDSLDDFVRPSPQNSKRNARQSRETIDSQKSGHRRIEEQEQKQRMLALKLGSMGVENNIERQAVSFDEPVVFLHPHIGSHAKPHQLNGIQFMWRELIKDPKQQGCLLAHTMGLGKTMQVISVLVTIADAANSPDPEIRDQVPEHLRESRTLILCPSSLVENWFEEFYIWTPNDETTKKNLGDVFKIYPLQTPFERVHTISKWYDRGGVLIISYDLFKGLVRSDKRTSRIRHSDKDDVKKQLLEGPNIIVADEAHKLKNKRTGVAQACSMFKSSSRIALTGSPLSNHLHDYYAMIDWIAPLYLGSPPQFKAKYEDPIKKGLYSESSRYERRRALMKLQVLKKDLEPKVNRHDITVLAGSVPPKVEFVIAVPLTKVQEQAYAIYIEGLQDRSDNNVRVTNWLNNLSVLCNHPACFFERLKESPKSTKPRRLRVESDSDNPQFDLALPEAPESPADDTTIARLLTPEALLKLTQLLESIQDLQSTVFSYRMQILERIVNESIRLGDKILLFSHSIPTLDYIGRLLRKNNVKFSRLDGETAMGGRQAATKNFNDVTTNIPVYLISTKAGGVGLNIQGANRVVLVDFRFNPSDEEQAVGRAFRFGQTKPVFVYHLITGGTFEDVLHNQTIFKMQLASQVVDKKNLVALASRTKQYLFPPREVKQEDLSEYHGKDKVLDAVLATETSIAKMTLTETFKLEEKVTLTEEELQNVQQELADQRLQREDPAKWAQMNIERQAGELKVRQNVTPAARSYAARRPSNGLMPPPPVPQRPQQQAMPGQTSSYPGPVQFAQQMYSYPESTSQPLSFVPQQPPPVLPHAPGPPHAEPPALGPDLSLYNVTAPLEEPVTNGVNLVSVIHGSAAQRGHPPSSSAPVTSGETAIASLPNELQGSPTPAVEMSENAEQQVGTNGRMEDRGEPEVSEGVEMSDLDGSAATGAQDSDLN